MSLASQKILQNQLKDMKKNPVVGFKVNLPDESDLYTWDVWIEGPPSSPYEGGIFKAIMNFPKDYPYSPPSLSFKSEFWHPNVYSDGKVCISILHPPGDDPMSGERPEERWLPTQTPETILLSVISLLSDPNISSPANVDASVEWRKNKDSFKNRVKKLVDKAMKELPAGFEMPKPEEIAARQAELRRMNESQNFFIDDDDEDFVIEDEDGVADEDDGMAGDDDAEAGAIDDEDNEDGDGDAVLNNEEEEAELTKEEIEAIEKEVENEEEDN